MPLERTKDQNKASAIYASTLGPVRYQNLLFEIDRGPSTLCFHVWAKADDYARFKEAFARMGQSLRLLNE